MTEENADEPAGIDPELKKAVDDELPDYTGVSEEETVWISMEMHIPDPDSSLDPEDLDVTVYNWMREFLEKRGYNVNASHSGETASIEPAQGGSWAENELFTRYKAESWFDFEPEDVSAVQESDEYEYEKRRAISIWFPVSAPLSFKDLTKLRNSVEQVLGDEVEDEYDAELDVRGPSLFASETQVMDLIQQLERDAKQM